MTNEPETPRHRKRKPTGKKRFGVAYKYLGPPTDHFLRQDSVEWFVTRAAAEQHLQRWVDGHSGFTTICRPRGSWTAEIVER